MKCGRSPAPWIVTLLALFVLMPSPGLAGPFDGRPKILLHVQTPVSKNRCAAGSLADCASAVTSGGLYPNTYLAYVLVARGSVPDLSGAQFGIDYDPGLAFVEWTLCAGLDYQMNGWPQSGTGNIVVWDWLTGCPTSGTAVAGYFYLTAYSPAGMRLVPRQADCLAKIARCPGGGGNTAEDLEIVLDAGDLGSASFGTGTGCNPCNQDCGSPPGLPPPGGLDATPACGEIALAWNPVAGAEGYQVHRDGIPMPLGAYLTGTTFTDVNPGIAERCYQVSAVTCAGDFSPLSAPACTAASLGATIDQSPSGGGLCAPNPLSLTVAAGGAGLTYQWRKNGINMTDGGRVAGAQTAHLVISPGDEVDTGSYDVVVTSPCGSDTTGAAAVSVCRRPAITGWANAPRYNHLPGTNRTLGVTVQAGCGPVAYQWIRNGFSLSDGARIGGAHTATLNLTNLQTVDSGYYYCRISNVCGTTVSPSVLIIVDPCVGAPVIQQQPADVQVPSGGPASFTFDVVPSFGFCPLNFRWYRNGQLVPGGTTSTLSIPAVTPADEGAYQAVSWSRGPAVYSRVARLNITKPVFVRCAARVDPTDCNRVLVEWEANVPVTSQLYYGFNPTGSAWGTSSLYTVTTPEAVNSVSLSRPFQEVVFCYRIRIADEFNLSTTSPLKSIGLPTSVPWLTAVATPLPVCDTLVQPNDALRVKLSVIAGCVVTTGPIQLLYVQLTRVATGATRYPRNPANPSQYLSFPQDITTDLPPLASADLQQDLLFRLADIGTPPAGETLQLRGQVRDGSSPSHYAWIYRSFPTPPPAEETAP